MAEQSQNPRRPRLRFPAFANDPEWEEHLLEDICIRISDKVGERKLIPVSITAGHGFVSQKSKFGRNIAGEQYKNYIYLKRGDFAYNRGNSKSYPQGYVCQLKEFDEVAASNAFICFRLTEDNSVQFIQATFDKNTHGKQLQRYITSSARSDGLLNINHNVFFKIKIPLPSLAEQQAIAECLSVLDERIAAEGARLAALKEHKQGLLQHLFPAPGADVPRLRFPAFANDPPWAERRLGDVATFSSGGTPSKDISKYWNGDIPWVSASSMHEPNISDSELKVTDIAINNGTRIAKKGSLLILVRGSMLFKRIPIGIACRDVAFNQDVKALALSNDVINVFLLYQLFSLESSINITSTGIGAGKIDTQQLVDFTIYLPSLAEQQAIAECLSALDERIAAQAELIAALKVHKKGLLQQLFPVAEEI